MNGGGLTKIIYENKESAVYYSNAKDLGTTAHLHKQIEVIYVRSGSALAYADKNGYKLSNGDLFITFPNQVHYYETLLKGEYMLLIFSPEIIYESGTLISKSIPENNLYNTRNNKDLKDVMDNIHNTSGEYKFTAINGYLNVMMSLLLPQMTLKAVSTNNAAFKSILDFCMHNFKEDISLEYVAENLHLSKYYISHQINKNLNINYNEYINSLRINEACNYLRETDMKIADISEDVGFGTIRSFNRSFKQLMGVSPAVYRNRDTALKELS